MIVEERCYTIAPAHLRDFLTVFERDGLGIIRPILGNLIGYFTTEVGMINGVVHLWGYDDMADREKRRAMLAASEDWRAFLPRVTPFIQAMENRILVPTAFSPLR